MIKILYSAKKKKSSLKLNKHNEISIRSMKNYTKDNFLELLRQIDFQNTRPFLGFYIQIK